MLPGQSISLSATQQLIPAPLINTIDEILEDGSPFGFIMKGALDLREGALCFLTMWQEAVIKDKQEALRPIQVKYW